MLVSLYVPTNFQMYRQNSEKALLGGGVQLPNDPPLATLVAINKRQYTDKTLTLRESMWASGASELRKFSYFHILKLLFLSIICWYFRYSVGTKWHACRLKYTDKTPKSSIIGGGQLPPLPPSGYANVLFYPNCEQALNVVHVFE